MIFNTHSNLAGRHALFSASKYHWIRYDDEKMERVFQANLAAMRGNELHAFAAEAIRLRINLPKTRNTLNLYVNDGIGYRMTPELVLYYSDYFFGTTDAISFRKKVLRIHDLKTGTTPTSEHQLEVYAALFCLEYRYEPFDITIELRIYQHNECAIYLPDPDDIKHIMEKIKSFDRRVREIREGDFLQ